MKRKNNKQQSLKILRETTNPPAVPTPPLRKDVDENAIYDQYFTGFVGRFDMPMWGDGRDLIKAVLKTLADNNLLSPS